MDDVKPGDIAGQSLPMHDADSDPEGGFPSIDDEAWSRMLNAAQLSQQPVVSEEQPPNTLQEYIDEASLQKALQAFQNFASSSSISAPSATGIPSVPDVCKLEPPDDDTFLTALQNAKAYLETSNINQDQRLSFGLASATLPASSTTTLERRPVVLQSNSPPHIAAAASTSEAAVSECPPHLTASSAELVSRESPSRAEADHMSSTGKARGPPYPNCKSLIRFPAEELERPDPRDLRQDFYHLLDPTYCIFRGADLENIFALGSDTNKNWVNSPGINPPSHFVGVIANPIHQ